jgi:hypothetical protein
MALPVDMVDLIDRLRGSRRGRTPWGNRSEGLAAPSGPARGGASGAAPEPKSRREVPTADGPPQQKRRGKPGRGGMESVPGRAGRVSADDDLPGEDDESMPPRRAPFRGPGSGGAGPRGGRRSAGGRPVTGGRPADGRRAGSRHAGGGHAEGGPPGGGPLDEGQTPRGDAGEEGRRFGGGRPGARSSRPGGSRPTGSQPGRARPGKKPKRRRPGPPRG